MKIKHYESPLEAMIKQLEDQEPPYRVRSFENDKVKFGFPQDIELTIGQQLAKFARPIGKQPSFIPTQRQEETFGQPQEDEQGGKQLATKASSTIQQAAYWPKKEYLIVSFKSGHTYDYKNVPLKVILNWEQAVSAGSFFYYNIRKSFSYSKLG